MEQRTLVLDSVPPSVVSLDKPLDHKEFDHIFDTWPVATPAHRKMESVQLPAESGSVTELVKRCADPMHLDMRGGIGSTRLANVLVPKNRRL